MKVGIMLTSAVLVACAYVTSASSLFAGKEATGAVQLFSPEDYPYGDPRQCTEIARKNKYEMKRFEVLPGFGWDNLRNQPEGQVVSFNYSQCRTTDDGRFLLPDSVSAVPVKASRVQTFAELISHWSNWTSSTSRSINVDAGLSLTHFSISGKFSYDFEEVKSKQIGDKSLTTRATLRYIRYAVQLQPDSTLHPVFKRRVLSIAAALELGYKDQARYQAQLLVRDFGTHVVTKADAGASLEQVDQIREDWVLSQQGKKSDILAAASFSLFSVFHMSASYDTKTNQQFLQSYMSSRTSSNILTKGGPLFKPSNFTSDQWASEVDSDLVALDRAGDPLYYVLTSATLPELPASVLNEVYNTVQEAVETYYQYNRIPGCLDNKSPNFSPGANVEDGTCKPPPTNLTFGGMFQTCSGQEDLCPKLREMNPLTGGNSCPVGYEQILLNTGKSTDTRTRHSCHSYWIFWKKCHDTSYTVEATYNLYWCVNPGSVSQDSGYLFGGLFTSNVENPVTRARSCPPTFFPLKVASGGDLQVCISDDYELGEQYALPFAGFISCHAGNPLAVSGSQSQALAPGRNVKAGQGQGQGQVPKSRGSLRAYYKDQADDWPMRCPDGYSKHLATVDQGCQINFCVLTGSMAGPVLPPIKRPPFVPAPPTPAAPTDNLVIFDPLTNTWIRNAAAMEMLKQHPDENSDASADDNAGSGSGSGSSGSSGSSISPGAAAGISIGATVGCVVIATVAVIIVKRKRARTGYRRLEPNSLLDPPGDNYGSVPRANRGSVATNAALVVNVDEGGDGDN